jgi:hypothetical protein
MSAAGRTFRQSVGRVAGLPRIMASYEGDAPRYGHGKWRRVFPSPGFGPLAEATLGVFTRCLPWCFRTPGAHGR